MNQNYLVAIILLEMVNYLATNTYFSHEGGHHFLSILIFQHSVGTEHILRPLRTILRKQTNGRETLSSPLVEEFNG